MACKFGGSLFDLRTYYQQSTFKAAPIDQFESYPYQCSHHSNRIPAILFTIIIFKFFLLVVIMQRITDWEKHLRQLHSVHLVQGYLGQNPPDAESHNHP
jgi:hypothetical protein